MEALTTKECSLLSSPYSSPNLNALLKIKIISWSQETGLPVTARVRVANKSFNLHKSPLMAKSGYFKRQLSEWQEVDLPEDFPGGPDTFEMIALFIYGSSTFIDPFNVASIRCAAEFLEMNEAYSSNNLCERSDLYLTRVVLQSWDDTHIVLQKCLSLLPCSEDLLIVSRCIESLAFMACMEILDPERKRGRPVISLEALKAQPWSSLAFKEVVVSQDLWIKDLISLPFDFFKRVVGSLRRQGMKEKYVCPMILFYANQWVLSKKTRQLWECLCDHQSGDERTNMEELILGILELLPEREKSRRVIPVGFYLSILARFLELEGETGETGESVMARLQEKIVALLPLAYAQDFLFPKLENVHVSSSVEVGVMERIFSMYFSSTMEARQAPAIVAELWDMYLSRLAYDPSMEPRRFTSLVDKVPLSYRISHDHLYKAMSTYLKAHPNLSQDEKGSVCKYLNCQKLSQEACVEAVQNELMPLRLIVQALFAQQLNTQQAFKECSESFRFAYSGEFSGTLSSSRNPTDEMAQTQLNYTKPETTKNEMESTSFRIQSLEQELESLKEKMAVKGKHETVRSSSKRRHAAFGQVSGCIGSVNFASHRKYGGRFLKIFRRISLLGRPKLRRQPSVTASQIN